MKWTLSFALCILLFSACNKPDPKPTAAFPPGKWVDLTYPFDEQTVYWPTAETFHLDTVFAGQTDSGYYYSAYSYCAAEHGGTHLDAPVHFAEGRLTMDQLPLDQLIGNAVVVDVSAQCASQPDYQVTAADFQAWESANGPLPEGVIVLLRTGSTDARLIEAAKTVIHRNFQSHVEAVNCHHNYVQKEHHFGEDVFVTRKGAVSAKAGQLGIIPGSMGARSYIVRGKGNADSFESCSHGAGRVMSRGEAKRRFTLADHRAATEGVECRKDKDVIDETPAAYKDIDAVMEAQRDLVDVVHTLKQVVCVKG